MDTNNDYTKLSNESINIHEYYEVEHWTKELHINVETLMKAVENVGSSIQDIRKFLNRS